MAVQIRRLTGSGPTPTNVTSINTRLNAEDAHSTGGTTNPILKPAAGTNYSFWAVFRLFFSGTGTGKISDIEWFTDGSGSLGTGRGLNVATANAYAQATGTPGVSGDELSVANYGNGTTDLNGAPVSAFTKTTGSPLAVDGEVTDPDNDEFGDYVVLQYTVGTTASAGAGSQETITWRWLSTIA